MATQCDVGKHGGGRKPRPLPKPKLKQSDKSELDRIVDQNLLFGSEHAPTAELAPTISDLLWNGTLEDFLQPMPDTTSASSSRPTISSSSLRENVAATGDGQGCGNKQPMLDRKSVSPSQPTWTDHQNLCVPSDLHQPQPHVEPQPNKSNWNRWEPDPDDEEEVYQRKLKDQKNVREKKRKKSRGLHV